MSTATFLIGPPGCGKTTFRAGLDGVAISTDDLIESWAAAHGVTYTEAFQQVDLADIERQMMRLFVEAIAADQNVVIDRTNMGRKARGRFLRLLPCQYQRIAVVFTVAREELDRRLAERAQRTGKVIGADVIKSMLERYEPPGEDEFQTIIAAK
jgi:predicted kinase